MTLQQNDSEFGTINRSQDEVQLENDPAANCESKPVSKPHLVTFFYCVAMARPRHYLKNILVLVGVALAGIHQPDAISTSSLIVMGWGIVATCLIASSNYVLNEILDAGSDRFHAAKCNRPMAAGHISRRIAVTEWFVIGSIGMAIAASISWSFFACATWFQLMAVAYNVPPIRLKENPYIDVLSEAVNSPIRLLLGWVLILPQQLPGFWLILAFWMAGAFEMARKRLNEYRFLADPAIAIGYRKSFAHYNDRRLKLSMVIYASAVVAFAAIEAALRH